jgi:RNA-directed DNA polymerase
VSPVLANLRRDGLDQAWARRGHRCVRDADDGHIDVRSVQAGQRVLARVTRCVERRLQLRVNAAKRAVDRPWRRTFLGCTCTGHRPHRRRVRETAWRACKPAGRRLTSRTRGGALGQVLRDLRRDLAGWSGYVGVAEAQAGFKEWASGLRRRRRCSQWKPWGRRRYRERRRRGISRALAWNPVRSAHGPWRLRRSPALAIALPGRDVDGRGLPRLQRGSHR